MKSSFKLTLLSSVTAAAATLMTAGLANATNGMLPHCVGTVKCGMGGAGSAIPGAAVDAAMNPALAGGLGNTYQVNLGWFFADVKGRSSSAASTTPYMQKSAADNFPNGSIGVNYTIDEKLSVNMSIVPGGGGASDWANPRSNKFFAGTTADQEVNYEMIYFQPSVAYKVSDTATYGAGAIISRAKMQTDSVRGSFARSNVEDTKETFWGVGFQVGGVWQTTENSSFALNLRSPVWHQTTGVYDGVVFNDPIDTPMQILAGVALDVTSNTKLALDYKWVNWSRPNTIGNDPYGTPTTARGFGWVDQHIVMLGVEHQIDQIALRAGLSHANSPITEPYVLANFLFPAIVTDHFTLGGDYDLGDGMKIGVSGYYAPENELYDTGAGNAAGTGAFLSHSQHGFQLSFSNSF